MNKQTNKRNFSFGTSSISIVVIVIGLVAIINFLAAHHQEEVDFTKNKIHAFSDESAKVMQNLKSELKADFYGDFSTKDRYQPLFENYQKLSKEFKLDFIDPIKEPARTQLAGVKKMDTLVLSYQGRSIKVDDLSEQKITNAILKIQKENKSVVCVTIGHGETSIDDVTQGGMQSLKTGLEDQSYVVKEISVLQAGVPEDCNSIVMVGARGIFFPGEMKALSDYLNRGGRAVFAVAAALNKKEDLSPEFQALLSGWGVEVKGGLIIDPEARKMGVDASLVLLNFYNPHHLITKDSVQPSYLPFVRPVDFKSTVPPGFKTTSIAKTSEQAWAETDMNSFVKGKAQYHADVPKGPLSVAVASEGKISKSAAKNTRLVVFGSGHFINNQYSRLGGNLDFFMNAVSWVLEDENLISIRTKDEDQGRVDLSDKEGTTLFWLTIVIIPFAIALLGMLIWLQRKKL